MPRLWFPNSMPYTDMAFILWTIFMVIVHIRYGIELFPTILIWGFGVALIMITRKIGEER